MTPLHSTHPQMATPLSDIEKSELSYLRELQANRHRWFSQEEFERLNELARRDWGTPGGPQDVTDMTDATPRPFGRYKDKRMDAVPAIYLLWLLDVKNESGHPAIFPIELAEKHILTWSNENDLVYDPFMGSGTTCLASKNNNRKFIGNEINETYYKSAVVRVFGEHCH